MEFTIANQENSCRANSREWCQPLKVKMCHAYAFQIVHYKINRDTDNCKLKRIQCKSYLFFLTNFVKKVLVLYSQALALLLQNTDCSLLLNPVGLM